MQRELWAELSAAISVLEVDFCDNARFTHSTALIVRTFAWSVIHDAATSWACEPRNWDRRTRPPRLPDQSTMSRRLRTPEFFEFMKKLEQRLRGLPGASNFFKCLDGKPLPIAAHSTDPHAGWGRGAGQKAKGYKLHAIWGGEALPLAWRVAPLNVSEQQMARRMLRDLRAPGYAIADRNFDSNELFDVAAESQIQLVCPRRYGSACGLGHRRHSPHRLRCKDMLEGVTAELTGFGAQLMRFRARIERDFANSVSFTGGLGPLPAWVRTWPRVQRWVWMKLLINAARIRVLNRRKTASGA